MITSRAARPGPTRAVLLALLVATLAPACTDVDLKQVKKEELPVHDNKLQLDGKFCTTDPADVVFPLKVLFIIDTSQSMNVNDPVSTTEADPTKQTGRAKAIRDVVSRFVDLKAKFATTYCNTGTTGCEKGSTKCATCGPVGKFMCIGPDCCKFATNKCHGVPACKSGTVNGTCAAVCDVTKAGCKPGEKSCPDCPDTGDQCMGGICGKHRDPGVEFGIMRFGSAKQVLTRDKNGQEGFTNDIKELVTAIPQVSNGGSVTDYEGALSKAYKVIDADVAKMKESNAAALSRAKYVVIFLSDGEPYPPINDQDDWTSVPCYVQADLLNYNLTNPDNCQNDAQLAALRAAIKEWNVPSRILKRVNDILSLKTYWGLGEISVHTAFLAGNNPSWVEDKATYLLKQMAQVGKGTFRNFPNGEKINFLHVGFSSLKRVFELKSFIATNLNAHPLRGQTLQDSDGDGLDDQTEVEAGTSSQSGDTDKDGFSDAVEHFFRASGWDALDPSDADCPLLNDVNGDGRPDDTDGDGLLDCEERFLGTSRNLFDSDSDGIPDNLEVRAGTNPVVSDIYNDLDFDGMANGDEIRLHTDPRSDDASHRSRSSYRYHITKEGTGIETVGLRCTTDAECPQKAQCKEGYCRCQSTGGCSSNLTCKKDTDCTYSGEGCVSGQCQGKWQCSAALAGLTDSAQVCAARRNITCYAYRVENISLVTPGPAARAGTGGWNRIMLYFGEAPFDKPTAYGNFTAACVDTWYDGASGAKRPVAGRLTVPQSAWKTPATLGRTYRASATSGATACGAGAKGAALYCSPGHVCLDSQRGLCQVPACVCPEGKVGLCNKQSPAAP